VKILIVDDEEIIRRSLRRAFESRGHTVQVAADGLTALNIWREFKPDFVMMDVIMPGLTGPQVLGERTNDHVGQVCLMSAFSGEYNREKLDELGIKYFFAKPFAQVFEVVDKIETWGKS
jgi:CheY-like chemotaxis protein